MKCEGGLRCERHRTPKWYPRFSMPEEPDVTGTNPPTIRHPASPFPAALERTRSLGIGNKATCPPPAAAEITASPKSAWRRQAGTRSRAQMGSERAFQGSSKFGLVGRKMASLELRMARQAADSAPCLQPSRLTGFWRSGALQDGCPSRFLGTAACRSGTITSAYKFLLP
jgi:hypothetical protein